MKLWKPTTIRSKLSLFISLWFLCILTITVGIIIRFGQQSLHRIEEVTTSLVTESFQQEWEEQVSLLAATLAKQFAQPLYNLDAFHMQQTANLIAKQAGFLYVYVQDAQGIILVDTMPGAPSAGSALQDPISLKATQATERVIGRQGNVVDVAIPIFLYEEKLGIIRIGYDTQNLQQTTNTLVADVGEKVNYIISETVEYALMGAIIIWILIILTTLLLVRQLTAPFRVLVEGTKVIAQGDLNHRFPDTIQSEVGTLAKAFNEMATDLQGIVVTKEYMNNIFTSMVDTLVVTDSHAMIKTVNRAMLTMLDYQENELIGQPISHLFPEEAYTKLVLLQGTGLEKLAAQTAINHLETIYRSKLGQLIPVRFSISPMRDKHNQLQGIICVAHDISDLKQAEMARVDAEKQRQQLERQLRQSQKMEAIGTMAGGIAHDFNNILQYLFIVFEYLELNDPDGQFKDQIAMGIKYSNRGKELIHQILAFSRMSEQSFKVISVASIVKETLKMMKEVLPSSIEIKSDLEESSRNIMGNASQIHQTVVNLCTNAGHAMKAQGGRLSLTLKTIHLSDTAAQVHSLKTGEYLKFSVKDTGTGISTKNLEKIFDPFYTTKKMGEGTGMGLSMVHGIVLRHGGAIAVESQEGKGTVFDLFFPAVQKQIQEEHLAKTRPPEGKERILLVDDEKEVTKIIKKILTKKGYQIEIANTGEEAFAIFQRETPNYFDILITDQTMPLMSGIQLIEAIREINHDIPVILMSGYQEVATEEVMNAIGHIKSLIKPVSTKDVIEAIQLLKAQG